MAIGPVEYMILGFPGNRFNGEIAPELGRLIDNGLIRILDLVFITRDADSDLEAVDFEHCDDAAPFHALDGAVGGFTSNDDIPYAAGELERNSSAALLIWVDLWGDAVRQDATLVRRGADRGAADPSRPDRSRRSRARGGRLNHQLDRTRRAPCCDVDHWPEQPSRRPLSSARRRRRGTASTGASARSPRPAPVRRARITDRG